MTVPPVLAEQVTFTYHQTDTDTEPTGTAGAAQPPIPPSTPALRDVSMTCSPGTLTVLCGPSGSGKSTLLQLLNGLVPHFHPGTLAGTVEVCGRPMSSTDLHDVGRSSATVFQNPRTQFFNADVASEIAFCLENYGRDRTSIQEAVTRAARTVGISHLLGRHLARLSGGEQQKIACACAVATDVPLLLLDEPTSNLSPHAIDELTQVVHQLKTAGVTVVVCEHRLYWLRDLTDQVLVLDQGSLVQQLTGDQLFRLDDQQRRALGLRCLTPPAPTRTAPVAGNHGLELQNVRFGYGRHQVLDIERLHLPAGQISVIEGANGAGKSTLTRVLCGLAEPEGTVLLDGVPKRRAARTAASYMVMQDVHRQLFTDSVLAEVSLGLPPDADQERRVRQILRELDLAEYADQHPLTLSGGQQQRLVIASALACGKKVLVFDEPTSGVDYRHMEAVARCLRRLADDGHVVVVITHDRELTAACADQVLELRPLDTLGRGEPQVLRR